MKRYWIVCLLFIFLLLVSCTPKKSPTVVSNSNPASLPADFDIKNTTLHALEDIRTLLANASKGSGNKMVKMFGLEDELLKIKKAADESIQKSEECSKLIDACQNNTLLKEVYPQIHDSQVQLHVNSDTIKAAKKDLDVDTLKTALNDLYENIQKYNQHLNIIRDELQT